jgi:glucose uptake protein
MILPHTNTAALLLMILGLLCWGSWANTYKLGRGRFELFYFDFAFGLLLVSLVFAWTAGSTGYDGFTFMDDVLNAGKHQLLYGFGAGVVFNFGNMLLTASLAVAGMSLAFPVGLGVALIVGAGLNYLVEPAGSLLLVSLGCVAVLAAVVLDSAAHRYLDVVRHESLAKAGKAKSTRRPTSFKGSALALAGGLLIGTCYPLLTKAQQSDMGVGPYALCVLFAIGAFASTFVFNMFFMNLPVEGEPLEVADYFKERPRRHLLGVAGGAVWCAGAIANFVALTPKSEMHAGPALGFALAKGAPLVAALWGIVAWRELRGGDARVKSLAAITLVLFGCGLALVSLAQVYTPRP